MNRLKSILFAGLLCLPMLTQAADKQNFIGLGVGLASVGGYSDTGYAFLFQIQQSPKAALGFAYHQGELITFTYKNYTGPYADSLFVEGGVLIATTLGVSMPVLGTGIDMPLGDASSLSLTAGVAFGDVGTAFIGRAAMMFKM